MFAVPSGRARPSFDDSVAILHQVVLRPPSEFPDRDTLNSGEARIVPTADTLLAECAVRRVGNAVGIPYDCLHFATVSDGATWIRVTAGFYGDGQPIHVAGVAAMRLTGRRPPRAGRGRPVDLDSLYGLLLAELTHPPFSLQIQPMPIKSMRLRRVIGNASFRPSPILRSSPPMREILDVDVSYDADSLTNDVTIFRIIRAVLNPQNTNEGYSRANSIQEKVYLDSMQAALGRVAAKLCEAPNWLDVMTLRCE